MSELKFSEIHKELSVPFPAKYTSWLPKAANTEKKQALALAYVDPRRYEDRLNSICPDDWSVVFKPWGDTQIICELTICDITRSSTGEAEENDLNTATSAEAQAFKRACSKFGFGRYLYSLPRLWGEIRVSQTSGKCLGFTDDAIKKLSTQLGEFLGLGAEKKEEPKRQKPKPTTLPPVPPPAPERKPGEDDNDIDFDDEDPFAGEGDSGSGAPDLPDGVRKAVIQYVNSSRKDGTPYITQEGNVYNVCKTEDGLLFSDFTAYLAVRDEVLLIRRGKYWNVYDSEKNGGAR